MAKTNRKCSTCGIKYSYCSNCDRNAPSWMANFHAENCKNIFQICTSFNVNAMSKHEAKAALEQCDLSNKENFASCVQRDLEKIFACEEQPKKRSKRVEIPMIEEPIEVPVHEVVTQEE